MHTGWVPTKFQLYFVIKKGCQDKRTLGDFLCCVFIFLFKYLSSQCHCNIPVLAALQFYGRQRRQILHATGDHMCNFVGCFAASRM